MADEISYYKLVPDKHGKYTVMRRNKDNLDYWRDADLRGARLRGADLWGTVGNTKEIKSMFIDKYAITWTDTILQIGCENHTIKEWFDFDDKTIDNMDSGALDWWSEYKDFIKQAIELNA